MGGSRVCDQSVGRVEAGLLGEDGNLALQVGDGRGGGVRAAGLVKRRVTKRSVATVENGRGSGCRDRRGNKMGVGRGAGGTSARAATKGALSTTGARTALRAEGRVKRWGGVGRGTGAREGASRVGARLATIKVASIARAGVAVETQGMGNRRSEGPCLDGAALTTQVVVRETRTDVAEVTEAGGRLYVSRTRDSRMSPGKFGAALGRAGRKWNRIGATGTTRGVEDVCNAGRIAA